MKTLPIHFLVAMLLMLVWAAGVPAQQPRLIMSGAPEFVGLCIDANLYIVKQENTIVAYDMNSGGTRWNYDAWPPDMYLQAQQGKNRVVLYGKDEERYRVVVLEKASGKELWEHTERAPDAFRGVMVLPDSDWFLLRYARDKARNKNREEDYFLLFSPDGAGRYRLPEGLWPREWQEEGKTLVLTGPGKEGIRLVHWDLETNTTRDIGTYSDGLYSGRLHSGGLLLYRYLKDKQPQHTLKVVDGDSGRLLRQVTLPGDIGSPPILVRGGKAVLALADTGDRLWMLDTGHDKVLATLHHPGHEFLLASVDTDASGRIWVVSRDGENQIYLWPVEPGTAPRKIFDQGPFLSGYPFKVIPPHVITVIHSENGITTLHAYNFEERRVAAVWKPSTASSQTLPCASMRHCAVRLPGSDQAQRYGAYNWEILESGASEPLLKFKDIRMPALSPDGAYVVTQALEEDAVLMQVSTGETLYKFPSDERSNRAYAVFASDSRTVAVYGGFDAYMVVRITEEGCVETPLEFHRGTWLSAQCFSPDGTRLLSATRGEAWLHDTATGRLLHTFIEPQQLRSQYVRTPVVLGVKMPFVNYLGDLAGNFTNLANSKPELEAAFIEDGARMVTVAEAQLMRVWDCQTGRSVHVIDAGLSNTRNEGGFMENTITLSGNGAYALAYNRFDTHATLWDLKAGTAVRKWSHWKPNYWAKHISDNGKSIYLTINNSLYWLEGR